MTILVVDDDPVVLTSCRRVLEAEGYRVVTSTSAMEGLALLDRDRFDLLLADVKMPEHDGLELAMLVQRKRPELPILIMSGYPTPETIQECMECGAMGFIPKPFTPDELLASVHMILPQGAA